MVVKKKIKEHILDLGTVFTLECLCDWYICLEIDFIDGVYENPVHRISDQAHKITSLCFIVGLWVCCEFMSQCWGVVEEGCRHQPDFSEESRVKRLRTTGWESPTPIHNTRPIPDWLNRSIVSPISITATCVLYLHHTVILKLQGFGKHCGLGYTHCVTSITSVTNVPLSTEYLMLHYAHAVS